MNLSDLRKLAIRRQICIRFALPNQMECVVDHQGTARVPGLKAPPQFNLEQDLSSASDFVLEPVVPTKTNAVEKLTRAQLEQLFAGHQGVTHEDDHED
ncbi:MAG: hypothetical protein JJE04_05720 [Acidobacteriia bacterium]|nr:hypothetical protein [Terriglobia bacterium]